MSIPPSQPPPPVRVQIRFDTLVIYGEHRFMSRSGTLERVTSLSFDVAQRQMFALSAVDGHPVVVRLLLYATTAVVPPVGDVQGGTLVRVYGEGFVNSSDLQCVFHGTVGVPATWQSASEVAILVDPQSPLPLSHPPLPSSDTHNRLHRAPIQADPSGALACLFSSKSVITSSPPLHFALGPPLRRCTNNCRRSTAYH